MEEKYLVCEDSLEGIFTGIYEAYALREPHEQLHIQIGEEENLRLFAVYIPVKADSAKAVKVSNTIYRELGEETYLAICHAIAGTDTDKGEAVYKTIVIGLGMRNKRQVMGNLANPYVHRVFELNRNSSNEIHRWKEFLRFQELENGIMFAKIGPKCDVVTFIMPHFADRLPLIDFIIYDETRGIFGVHPASKQWYLVTDKELDLESLEKYSKEEEDYQELFYYFCHKIAIKERMNLKLQMNMLPLWYQEYMVEFGK